MFQYTLISMDERAPNAIGPMQITEEDLASSAPTVRALLVARLEQLWSAVHVHLLRDGDGAPVDPRMLEIGLRIVKEESLLYRLQRPPALSLDEDDDIVGGGVDRRAVVAASLDALEQKRNNAAAA